MADKTASFAESILQKPYWSFEEIIELAMFKRFWSDICQNDEEDEERNWFMADLLLDLREAILCGIVATVWFAKDLTWKERYKPYLSNTKMWGFPTVITILYFFIQKWMVTHPEIRQEIIKNGGHGDLQKFFFDLSKVFLGYPAIVFFVCWMIYLGYRVVKKLRSNTAQQKISHLISDLKFRGYTTNFYDSETVIDFLNSRYSLKIEKDPFRVWKEPFFKRNGDIWIVGFMGKRLCLKEKAVYETIAYLLSRPNEEFKCTSFVKGNPDAKGSDASTKVEPAKLDEYEKFCQKAKESKSDINSMKSILNYLNEGKENARNEGRTLDIDEYNDKIKMTERYILEYFTKSGEEKPPRDNATKARDAIKKAIDRCITELKKDHPFLAEHLSKTITRSYSLSYRPPEEIHWDIQI